MGKNTNHGGDNILEKDKALADVLRRHLAVLRYAFGDMIMAEADSDGLICLARKTTKSKSGYTLEVVDVEALAEDLFSQFDRCLYKQLSEYLVSKLALGVADYVLVSSECGMFIGSEAETADLQRDIELHGEDEVMATRKIDRTAAVVVYDLSGIVARAFASEANCIQTFLQWDSIERLMNDLAKPKPSILAGERPTLADIVSEADWVLDGRTAEDIPAQERALAEHGPLKHWDEAVWKVLEDMHGGSATIQ